MDQQEKEILRGGNMNLPLKIGDKVFKEKTAASETIHKLLTHARKKGIGWIPESFGINDRDKHVLEYIPGIVPHRLPEWIWNESLLIDVAGRLRQWHDATSDFSCQDAFWHNRADEPFEVVCHCDFAPYNCVFENHSFKGLIDFDVCAPGTRLWDIAYTAYRFVPLLPCGTDVDGFDVSHFDIPQTLKRLELFLQSYGKGDAKFKYGLHEVLEKVMVRLLSLSRWSEEFGLQNDNPSVIRDSVMYKKHAGWINGTLSKHLP